MVPAAGATRHLGGDALAVKAEQAFELIIRDYADCPRLMQNDQRTLGKEAEQELYGLRNLRVGKVAPDVEGQDLDEVKIKLAGHRDCLLGDLVRAMYANGSTRAQISRTDEKPAVRVNRRQRRFGSKPGEADGRNRGNELAFVLEWTKR